jgi:3-oxoacyl-[acyl-carrier protein] reductase
MTTYISDRLANKVVLITGATGAIAQTLCHALVPLGCQLGLLGRNAPQLERVAAELAQTGATVSYAVADMRDRRAVHDAIAVLAKNLGAADILINNAAVCRITQAAAPNIDDVEEILEVNYLGGVYATQAVLPAMLERGSGQLVAISSLASLRGMAWTAGYSASKAAFASFLESLRPALRQRGVYATTCYMGFVRTAMCEALPLHPMVWKITPEIAVRKIINAIARKRREAYFPWYDASVAAVLRRLPAWAFDAAMKLFGPIMVQGEY